MSLLPETNMINTFSELNKFSDRVGAKSRDDLLLELIKRQELVSSNIARLVAANVRATR